MTPTRPPIDEQRLHRLIDAMEDQAVLLLVDLVVDRFVTGTPKRISREAPVLILRYAGETVMPGGGANAAANVRALAGRPLIHGVLGDDANGRALRAELAGRGIATEGVLERPGYETPTKTRILAGFPNGIKQQVVRFDREQEARLSDAEREELARGLEARSGARVAILSDYGYGAVDPALLPAARRAVGPGGLTLVDSRFRLADFRDLDGATPNEEEAESLLGRAIPQEHAGAAAAARELREKLEARVLLVTRGSRGMLLATAGEVAQIPVHGTDQVADVTGAGDTVIGTFALALAAGASPVEGALLANYAGGVVVMKMGTATLVPRELHAAVAADSRPLLEMTWEGS